MFWGLYTETYADTYSISEFSLETNKSRVIFANELRPDGNVYDRTLIPREDYYLVVTEYFYINDIANDRSVVKVYDYDNNLLKKADFDENNSRDAQNYIYIKEKDEFYISTIYDVYLVEEKNEVKITNYQELLGLNL